MNYTVINFLPLVAVATAISAMSCTITMAKISEPFRNWVARKSSWIGKLLNCSYCFSHWVALLFVIWYKPIVITSSVIWVDYFVAWFSLVGLAAIVTLAIKTAFFNGKEITTPQKSKENYE